MLSLNPVFRSYLSMQEQNFTYIGADKSYIDTNGDGLNDFFLAKVNSVMSYKMQVFDRWGGLVFESNDIDSGWSGENLLGINLAKGVYLYHVELYDENGKLWVYNGELSLIR